eukprot:scpid87683/ scgid24794/ 
MDYLSQDFGQMATQLSAGTSAKQYTRDDLVKLAKSKNLQIDKDINIRLFQAIMDNSKTFPDPPLTEFFQRPENPSSSSSVSDLECSVLDLVCSIECQAKISDKDLSGVVYVFPSPRKFSSALRDQSCWKDAEDPISPVKVGLAGLREKYEPNLGEKRLKEQEQHYGTIHLHSKVETRHCKLAEKLCHKLLDRKDDLIVQWRGLICANHECRTSKNRHHEWFSLAKSTTADWLKDDVKRLLTTVVTLPEASIVPTTDQILRLKMWLAGGRLKNVIFDDGELDRLTVGIADELRKAKAASRSASELVCRLLHQFLLAYTAQMMRWVATVDMEIDRTAYTWSLEKPFQALTKSYPREHELCKCTIVSCLAVHRWLSSSSTDQSPKQEVSESQREEFVQQIETVENDSTYPLSVAEALDQCNKIMRPDGDSSKDSKVLALSKPEVLVK